MRAAWSGDAFALQAASRPSDVRALLRLARGRRTVVELGTATGWTTASLVAADKARTVTSYDPVVQHPGRELLAPGPDFLLGTDELGRDLLSRVIYGTRPSLVVALMVVVLGGGLGIITGLAADMFGMNAAMWLIAALTCVSGTVVAIRMTEPSLSIGRQE